jgi:predicted nucleotidyltransferase
MVGVDRARALADSEPDLRLLLLYGSRARGDARPDSDWDFGYLAADGFDPDAFLGALVRVLGSDRVDLVDLGRASGLLRYRAAAEGVVISERPGALDAYRMAAVSYWLDMQAVIRAEYDRVLERLSR